ncbi:hypothetical protein ACFO5U_08395 [Planococcus dechangensis]|uniref:ABC transporter substrate-binding protein n=2 Tax=Planococcus dechangensis TaxID=1176255 RepID=A0ABV9MCJ5_9BACL
MAAQTASTGSKALKNIPVSGQLEDGRDFDGKLTITEFSYDEAEGLLVSGVLKGKTPAENGKGVTVVNQSFENVATNLTSDNNVAASAFQTAQQAPGCQILFLDLGPIFLDVLGLQVDLSQIVLDITAVPGAGNLLGNLLCAVAGLLDGTGFLNGLFDELIGALEGLLDALNNLL